MRDPEKPITEPSAVQVLIDILRRRGFITTTDHEEARRVSERRPRRPDA